MEPLFPTPGPEHVAEAVARLVAAADPLQIVVFGSVARGDAGPDSDLDLLVVMPDGTDRRAARRVLSLSLGMLPVPKDVVVTTPVHSAEHADSCWHIVATALREGHTVYSRPRAPQTRPSGSALQIPTSSLLGDCWSRTRCLPLPRITHSKRRRRL